MAIKVSLLSNNILKEPGEYYAKTHSVENLTQSDMIDRLIERGTTVQKQDLEAALSLFNDEVVKVVKKGIGLNLPLLALNYSVKGKFSGPRAELNKEEYHVKINLTKGPLLREVEEKLKVKKTNPIQPNLAIQNVRIVDGMLEIKGFNIRIEGADAACGLWFVDEDNNETRVTSFLENNPSKLVSRVPATLTPGKYRLKVVTKYSGSKSLLKESRENTYSGILTIK